MARLFLDMDGTLARFHDEINYLERMFEEGFFAELKPFENMVAGAKLFMQQHPEVEVYVISSSIDSPYCRAEKNAWLDKNLNIPEDHRIFPPIGASKADYIPGGVTKDDHLLDDYNRGLNQFMYDGGSAIKCHNNINQQGLGAHGGRAGDLWVGAMVHVDDKPEMIAAELAQCMGLSYDLETVKQAYNVQVPKLDRANPLDFIRFQAGKPGFYTWELFPKDSPVFSLPTHRLKAICMNEYHHDDITKLYQTDDLGTFQQNIHDAMERAKLPLVGRLDFKDNQGNLLKSLNYHSQELMEKDLAHCWDNKIPVSYTWYVKTKPLSRGKEKSNPGYSKSPLASKVTDASNRLTPNPKPYQPNNPHR